MPPKSIDAVPESIECTIEIASELTMNAMMIAFRLGALQTTYRHDDLQRVADERHRRAAVAEDLVGGVARHERPRDAREHDARGALLEDRVVELQLLRLLHVAREPLLEAVPHEPGAELGDGDRERNGVGEDLRATYENVIFSVSPLVASCGSKSGRPASFGVSCTTRYVIHAMNAVATAGTKNFHCHGSATMSGTVIRA